MARCAPESVPCQTMGPLRLRSSVGAESTTTTGAVAIEVMPAASVCTAVSVVAPTGSPFATTLHAPEASAVARQLLGQAPVYLDRDDGCPGHARADEARVDEPTGGVGGEHRRRGALDRAGTRRESLRRPEGGNR